MAAARAFQFALLPEEASAVVRPPAWKFHVLGQKSSASFEKFLQEGSAAVSLSLEYTTSYLFELATEPGAAEEEAAAERGTADHWVLVSKLGRIGRLRVERVGTRVLQLNLTYEEQAERPVVLELRSLAGAVVAREAFPVDMRVSNALHELMRGTDLTEPERAAVRLIREGCTEPLRPPSAAHLSTWMKDWGIRLAKKPRRR